MTRRHLLLLALLLAATPAHGADNGDAAVPWNRLNPQEQQLLRHFRDRWGTLAPAEQQRLRQGAQRWAQMTPEQRQRARERLQRWRRLSPEQRQRIRERIERFRQLPPQEQARIRSRMEWFHSLPPEQREQWRRRWHAMTPQERRQFLEHPDDPAAGGAPRDPQRQPPREAAGGEHRGRMTPRERERFRQQRRLGWQRRHFRR